MSWLIFTIAVIAYIVIGQFVAGMLYAEETIEIVGSTLLWPIAAVVITVIVLFKIPAGHIRKLGNKFAGWLERQCQKVED